VATAVNGGITFNTRPRLRRKKMDEYYIHTSEVINEEDNGEEHTYFIKGRISRWKVIKYG